MSLSVSLSLFFSLSFSRSLSRSHSLSLSSFSLSLCAGLVLGNHLNIENFSKEIRMAVLHGSFFFLERSLTCVERIRAKSCWFRVENHYGKTVSLKSHRKSIHKSRPAGRWWKNCKVRTLSSLGWAFWTAETSDVGPETSSWVKIIIPPKWMVWQCLTF